VESAHQARLIYQEMTCPSHRSNTMKRVIRVIFLMRSQGFPACVQHHSNTRATLNISQCFMEAM
jgi:hypothetical protein